MLTATVSGSFHRHMSGIYCAVGELRAAGVSVLSPSDPRVVDHLGDFLFVASDRLRSIKLVQNRHFEAIRCSNFLWVVCPDGYTGPSTCMEIGTAVAGGVPVFSNAPALDITVGEYVQRVASYAEAIEYVNSRQRIAQSTTLLLDPELVIDESITALNDLRPSLMGRIGDRRTDAERQYNSTRRTLTKTLGLNPL